MVLVTLDAVTIVTYTKVTYTVIFMQAVVHIVCTIAYNTITHETGHTKHVIITYSPEI